MAITQKIESQDSGWPDTWGSRASGTGEGNDWIVNAEWDKISRLVAGRRSLRSIRYPWMTCDGS